MTVQENVLKEGLEQLFDTVASPILSEEFVEGEAAIVESEFIKGLSQDSVRYNSIQRMTSRKGDPYGYFATGNQNSVWEQPTKFGINVTQALQTFYETFYSANLMVIAVAGPQPLDELEDSVARFFSDVPNKGTLFPIWDTSPYGREELGTILEVVPISDVRELDMYFPILVEHWEHSLYYVGIFEHESKNSLAEHLKKLGYISYLTCERSKPFRDYRMILISAVLTPSGLERQDHIVQLVFEYISMLKLVGPQEWFWDEMQQIADVKRRWRDPHLTEELVTSIGADLLEHSIEESILEAVFQNRSVVSYSEEILTNIAELLTPDNMRLTILSPRAVNKTKFYEPIYKIHYNYGKIESEKLTGYANSSSNIFRQLPPPNAYIPELFQIKSQNVGKQYIRSILVTEYSLMWYLEDTIFKVPKVMVRQYS
ncbi:insulin-degrading enzyme [Folsomia candida]|uniref:insulin-degrading enzyme n=1 Tax=Folsomia candida TaxID=158441 RepID=UPI000B8F4C54|nr:insulin-degrading enzyme [Folsomia candida]